MPMGEAYSRPEPMTTRAGPGSLERRQERHEVRLFRLGENEPEGGFVVSDDGRNVRCDPVVEIRRTRREAANVRRLELVQIGEHTVADAAARIGALDDGARGAVLEGVDGFARTERRPRRADVEQHARDVLAVVGGVVTTAARTAAAGVRVVEDFLTAVDALAVGVIA